MVRKEAVYGRGEGLTPEVAAELIQAADRYDATLQMQIGSRRVLLDSLIGILSVDCRRGTRLTVLAEGEDEQAAADAIVAMVEKRD